MPVGIGSERQLDTHGSQLASPILERHVPEGRVTLGTPDGQIQKRQPGTLEFQLEVLAKTGAAGFVFGLGRRCSDHPQTEAESPGCEQGSEIGSVTGHLGLTVPSALASRKLARKSGNISPCRAYFPAEVQVVKVYLDDSRPTPSGWVPARWPDEVIRLLEQGDVTELSLDHDLGDDARGTGYDVLIWIEEAVATRGFRPPRISVHSANPAAGRRMLQAISAIERLALRSSDEV